MGERKEKGRLSPVAVQEKQWQWWGVPDEHLSLEFFSGAAGANNEGDEVDFFLPCFSPCTVYSRPCEYWLF